MASTNNDPKVIAQYYLDAVNQWGAPVLLRTDAGTENGIMAAIHSYIHQSCSKHIYGKSTSNQRIEALWSHFKPACLQYADIFRYLVQQQLYHQGHELLTAALRFSFMDLIQQSLNQFKSYWNVHHVRQSSEMPGGVPNVLFYMRPSLSTSPSDGDLVEARRLCVTPHKTGSEDYDNYLEYVMQHENFGFPTIIDDAVLLYTKLAEIITR